MRIVSYLLFTVAIILSTFFGWQLYDQSKALNIIKADFAKINEVKYGLFNLEKWKSALAQIFEEKIESFEFSDENYDIVQKEVEKYLGQLYDEYFSSGDMIDSLMAQASENASMVNKIFLSVLKNSIVKQLEDLDFKSNIPVVAKRLVEELKKKSPELKKVFSDQLKSILDDSAFSVLDDERQYIYTRYGENSLEGTNEKLKTLIEIGSHEQKKKCSLRPF